VRVVGVIEGEALRKGLEQASIGCLGVIEHRCVGFEGDIDRCHAVLFRDRARGGRKHQRKAEANGHEHRGTYLSRVTCQRPARECFP